MKNMNRNRVILTGASGFIGSHIAQYFFEKNVEVACLVRKTSSVEFLKKLPVKIVYGNIRDFNSLKNILKDSDCVVHTAAFAKDWGKYEDFYETNVTGTLNVLRACRNNGINNIIITGSISSYGEENSSEIKNEESPDNPQYNYFLEKIFPSCMNFYRVTKSLATKQAINFAKNNNLNLTVIEPVWVYGEREFSTGFYEYMKTVKTGLPFFPGCKKNKFHVVYARDLARAYYLAFRKGLSGVHKIIVGNKESEYMDTIYSTFCKELGIKKPVNIPKSIVYPIGFLMEFFAQLFNLKSPPLLTRSRVNMFYDNIEYSTKKAQGILLFTNKYTLKEGIKRTVKWYRDNNLI